MTSDWLRAREHGFFSEVKGKSYYLKEGNYK